MAFALWQYGNIDALASYLASDVASGGDHICYWAGDAQEYPFDSFDCRSGWLSNECHVVEPWADT